MKKIIIGFVLGLLVGFGFRGLTFPQTHASSRKMKVTAIRVGGYKFIDPLLRIDVPDGLDDKGMQNLKTELDNYTNYAIHYQKAVDVSVYFRDEGTSNWFVIGGDKKYSPASLLKVAIMMFYYKETETDESLFDRQLTFNIPADPEQTYYPPAENLTVGQSYTIKDLIGRMIKYSDNNAKNLLLTNMTDTDFYRVFDAIKVDHNNTNENENFMTVANYASFFRSLYNATYLKRDDSESAMELLTQTDFIYGLTAGVPDGIKVAHKFGERATVLTGELQLHDCGIIYPHTGSPYLMCVMTRGTNYDDLSRVIADTSRITYKAMTAGKDK